MHHILSLIHDVSIRESHFDQTPSFLGYGLKMFGGFYVAWYQMKYLLCKANSNTLQVNDVFGKFDVSKQEAVKLILIAQVADKLLCKYKEVVECYRSFKAILSNQYPVYMHVDMNFKDNVWLPLAPSEYYSLALIKNKFSRVLDCSNKLLRALLKLSHESAKSFLLFEKPLVYSQVCYDEIREFNKIRITLLNNRRRVLKEITKRNFLIEIILNNRR